MKKLLVTAIGAAAAFGAIAGEISTQRIKDITDTGSITVDGLNTVLGNYWSEPAGATNTYAVSALSSIGTIAPPIDANPGKALDVKTTFGKPLSVNIVSGGTVTNIPNSGIYFDSLVKFTVCEDTPTETYDGAKIIMWLQEQYGANDTITGTNLMVRAGYMLSPGNVVATNYTCNVIDGAFADAWHRVTIKAIPDITLGAGLLGHVAVPGFAIFIDNELKSSDDDKWAWADGVYPLTEAAAHLREAALFPSLVQSDFEQNKGALTCASFDGTGSLTDIVFTDLAPFEAAEDWVDPRASIVDSEGAAIAGSPFKSLATAVAAANGLSSGTYTFTLSKGLVLDEPLSFASSANIILDFAGFVLTNESDSAAAISNTGNLTITNSTINVGGIYCADDGAAIYQGEDASLEIAGGNFWGDITAFDLAGETITISGGAFAQQGLDLEDLGVEIADGKVVSETQNADGLYEVIDYVPPTYTVKFISGEGSTTNEYTEVVGEEVTVPTPAAVAGKSFSAWDPAIAGATVTVEADVTYTAQYTNNIYTITFVIGESSSSVQKEYGSEITSVPEIPVRPGYTGAWDDDPAGDTVTGDKTYTYTYSAQTYTITFVNGIGTDPASTDYTIESGTITLPTATTENVGVQFDGWTNATITTAITSFTPTTGNVGDFTLYAAWSSTGSSGFDGGDGNSFTIDPGTVSTVEALTGASMTDTVAGSDMTYAQAYALGLIDSTGDVADLDATIEMKDGKVVVGLSSTPSAAYTITLKVYEKASLTAAWPAKPTQTYTLDSATATTGFTPSGSGAGFYKTEVTISNK